MPYHWICSKNNTTGTTSVARTANPSYTQEFIPGFSMVRIARSLAFVVVSSVPDLGQM